MSEIQTLLSQRQLPALPQTRQEMLNILAHEEYGPLPPAPRGVSAEIIGKPEMKCAGHAVYVEYLLTADMGDFEVSFPVRCILPRSMTPAAKPPLRRAPSPPLC